MRLWRSRRVRRRCGGPSRGPGQHLADAMSGMVGELGEDVGEPGARIDVIEFACLCREPNYADRVRYPQHFQ